MTTVVNNPAGGDPGNGMGAAVAVALIMAVILIFFVYGLPAIRSGASSVPSVQVPDKVDVNINQPGTSNTNK